MVGYLGKEAIASVSLANSVFFMLIIFGLGMSMAIPPLISYADAKKNYKEVAMIFYHSMVLNFILSLVMYGLVHIFFYASPYFEQPKEIMDQTISFLKILSISFFPWIMFEIFRKFSEGLQIVYPSLIITWLAAIINVILNYLFINGYLGFPKLGFIGVAYATLISRIIMLIGISFILYLKYNKIRFYVNYLKFLTLEKTYIKKILKTGIPSGLHMLFEMGSFAVSSFISGKCGIKVLAAHQVVINLVSSTFLIITGFSITATIRISNQLALKKYYKLNKIGLAIIFMGSIVMLICSLIFIYFRNEIPYFYIKKNDYEIIPIIEKMIIIASIFQISDGIQGITIGILRGLQDFKIPMWISFFSYWIIGLPISWFLSLKMGGIGVWIGIGIGLTISSILLIIRYNIVIKNIIKYQKKISTIKKI